MSFRANTSVPVTLTLSDLSVARLQYEQDRQEAKGKNPTKQAVSPAPSLLSGQVWLNMTSLVFAKSSKESFLVGTVKSQLPVGYHREFFGFFLGAWSGNFLAKKTKNFSKKSVQKRYF